MWLTVDENQQAELNFFGYSEEFLAKHALICQISIEIHPPDCSDANWQPPDSLLISEVVLPHLQSFARDVLETLLSRSFRGTQSPLIDSPFSLG